MIKKNVVVVAPFPFIMFVILVTHPGGKVHSM